MIYQTVTESDFIRAFDDANRSANFTPFARCVLFEYFDSLSDDLGESIELDPIAICCDWAEYSEEELIREFGYMVERGEMDSEEYRVAILEEMHDSGVVLMVDHIGEDSTYLFSE